MIVRATRKILETNQLKPSAITPEDVNNLNEWYAASASSGFRGKPLMLFVHAKSLLTVITTGKSLHKNHASFLVRLRQLMKRSHFPPALAEQVLAENNKITHVGTTASKSVLAKINQIVLDTEAHCLLKETFEEIDFTVIENGLFDVFHRTGKKVAFSPEVWWNYYIQGEDAYSGNQSQHPLKRIIRSSELNRDGLTEEEELHMENQVLRMDLEQKFGKPLNLQVQNDEQPTLPPHLENQFLKHMNVFEQQIRHAREITVYEALGKPALKPADSLRGAKITREIARIFKLLARHNILVDFLAEYPPEVVYHFLAVELMEKKIPDINVPGFITHLVYEEFHPNHPYNIALHIRNFMHTAFDQGADEANVRQLFEGFNTFRLNGKDISIEDMLNMINTFHLTGKSERIIGYDLVEIDISKDETTARVEGAMVYRNELKGKRRIRINFTLYLENRHQQWPITGIDFEDWDA